MEQGIYLSGISKAELKDLIRESVSEILKESKDCIKTVPDILSIKQAAAFLDAKVTTIYEKTSDKIIPQYNNVKRL